MLRILLVLENYNERYYLQSLLKKLGFDVEVSASSNNLEDIRLSFNPQILVITANGKNINGYKISQSIKRRQGMPYIFLVARAVDVDTPSNFDPDSVDEIIEAPINILDLVKEFCNYGGVSFESISDKLKKLMASGSQAGEAKKVSGTVAIESSMTQTVRGQKYEDYLKHLKEKPEGIGGFSKDKIKNYNQEHKKIERSEEMKALDDAKKNFVNSLYSDKKS